MSEKAAAESGSTAQPGPHRQPGGDSARRRPAAGYSAASSAQSTAATVGPNPPARQWPPMLLSLGFHVLLLVALVWIATGERHGTGAAPDRPIGIAMVHRLPDRDEYAEVTAPTEQSESTAASSAAAASAPPADLSPPIDLEGILSAMQSTPAPKSGSGLAGDNELDGDALGGGAGDSANTPIGQTASASVFGVSGSGNRFVYVFDRSDSMNGFGKLPLRSAKRELIRSLNSLSSQQQFQIIFYNDNVKPFQIAGSPMSMVAGESANLTRAQHYVESIRAFGGTEHKGALLMALRMSPDVIFFLTDAHIPRMSAIELNVIQDRAQRNGTTIHAIEFGSMPAAAPDSFLRELAAMNNGQYQYIDVHRLAETQ
ncbi:hypothetical protein NHH03_27440 [Stieleria sp. TO1_6]|uniref:hypothetical protein n=1 Tax=Stieleria tagensis TaxID=2956795 RepID=UPI00209AC5C5|nr:hypothetical protein [Stieleria tagensis]MCO8125503.1 hypothetical protein [Stieleria tagensis]